MRYSAVLLIVVIISTVCSATEDTVKLVKNIKPAVVLIQTFDANNSPLATGSGFFIDNKGSLITNHHVIEGAYSATVKTSQGKESAYPTKPLKLTLAYIALRYKIVSLI